MILRVTWLDALQIEDWTVISNLDSDPCKLVSVGTLVKETGAMLWLAREVDGADGTARSCIGIPQKMIVRREEWEDR